MLLAVRPSLRKGGSDRLGGGGGGEHSSVKRVRDILCIYFGGWGGWVGLGRLRG